MITNYIKTLQSNTVLTKTFLEELLELADDATNFEILRKTARETALSVFSNKVFIRGLIEITNYCKNDCYYCGIRKSNLNAERYRLTPEIILKCCEEGYGLGFRTFVLQGGEDFVFNDATVTEVIKAIRSKYPDCAITLSLGERPFEVYETWKTAGADRYLLRHETANTGHYSKLHPENLNLDTRKECLYNLKKLGYQVGTGFMVGSPFQTRENIIEDLLFIDELKPQMIGIGPFLPHADTPFKDYSPGSLKETLKLLAILRIRYPKVLIPSTTALSTLDSKGRNEGILSGANVVMPNLSPLDVRSKYLLYDNKIALGTEAAENIASLNKNFAEIGYEISYTRGDYSPNL